MAILAFPGADDSLSLPVVPPLVQYLLLHFLAPILAWLSDRVYQALLLRCQAHPLVRLAHLYDPSPVVAALQRLLPPGGTRPGRQPIPSVR